MKVFIAMPFAEEFNAVYAAIKDVSQQVGLTAVRGDEVYEPGPIVQQIFKDIAESDFVIAEISSKNPNVYYEVALAHCSRKPTLLLANNESVKEIPFDIRHNRVLVYDEKNIDQLKEQLSNHLKYFIHHLGPDGSVPSFHEYVNELGSTHGNAESFIMKNVEEVAKQYKLVNPGIAETKFSPEDGYIITLKDDFGERVVFTIDVNGIRRRTKLLN
jgi:hypothetical protein